MGHAFAVNRSTLARADRDCIAAEFVRNGFRVMVFDIRGRRESIHDNHVSHDSLFQMEDEDAQDEGDRMCLHLF